MGVPVFPCANDELICAAAPAAADRGDRVGGDDAVAVGAGDQQGHRYLANLLGDVAAADREGAGGEPLGELPVEAGLRVLDGTGQLVQRVEVNVGRVEVEVGEPWHALQQRERGADDGAGAAELEALDEVGADTEQFEEERRPVPVDGGADGDECADPALLRMERQVGVADGSAEAAADERDGVAGARGVSGNELNRCRQVDAGEGCEGGWLCVG